MTAQYARYDAQLSRPTFHAIEIRALARAYLLTAVVRARMAPRIIIRCNKGTRGCVQKYIEG
jgi:hypothetical protein